VDCRKLRSTSAARALQEEAAAEDASLLVVGSPARRLLHGSPCPVAVVPRGWRADGKPRTVGVAYVDTDEGRAALLAAHALARRAGATLRAISVVKATMEMHLETETYVAGQFGRDLEDVEGEHRLWAARRLHEAVEELNDGVPVEVEAVVGDPAETLIATSEHLDLLVCGSRGYGPVRGVLLGSVSRRVTAEARCPVMVLRRGAAAGSAPVAFLAEHELLGQGRASRR